MSQHLIHVCVTDAPAWSQRERGKSERRRKSKQSRTGKKGGGERGGQHNGANEEERERGKQTRKQEIRLIRFLRKTKPKKEVGQSKVLHFHSCGSAPNVSSSPWGSPTSPAAGND